MLNLILNYNIFDFNIQSIVALISFLKMAFNQVHLNTIKSDLIILIKKVKVLKPELGAYIEHFHYNENTIIIKLTNGFLKISESVLVIFQENEAALSDMDLHKIGITFEKTLL